MSMEFPERDDFDLHLNGAKMREILTQSGLADTNISHVMENVRKEQQIRMVELKDEAEKCFKRSTDEFNFVATVNHQQVLDILREAAVPEKAILQSLARLEQLMKMTTVGQLTQRKVKSTIYWGVNLGNVIYYPASDSDHHRHLLLSDDEDPVPNQITTSGQYPHVVVVTKDWETALHSLNKLKRTDVKIIYLEFMILERPYLAAEFKASPLVKEGHKVYEWVDMGLQKAIDRHIDEDRIYPSNRGVRGINMGPSPFDSWRSSSGNNRHFARPQIAEPPSKRRPLFGNPPSQMNNWPESRQYFNNRYGASVSPKKEGGMQHYGFGSQADEERYGYNGYASMAVNPPLPIFGAQQHPYDAFLASLPPQQNSYAPSNYGYNAPPLVPSQMGIHGGNGDGTFMIPKEKMGPGGMDLLDDH